MDNFKWLQPWVTLGTILHHFNLYASNHTCAVTFDHAPAPHSMHFYYTGTASDKYAGTYIWTVYVK